MKVQLERLWTSDEVLRAPHVKRMGPYARLYDYLRQKRTKEDGTVNYGRPMTDERIAKELGVSKEWVRRGRRRLTSFGYIDARLVRRGVSVLGIAVKIAWPLRQMKLAGWTGSANLVQMWKENPVYNRKGVGSNSTRGRVENDRVSLKNLETTPRKGFRSANRGPATHISNWEQKAERLRREIQVLLGAYVGGGELPEHARRRVASLSADLDQAETHIAEFHAFVGARSKVG